MILKINTFLIIWAFLVKGCYATETQEDNFDLAIIGAGVSGVSHAYYLKKENPNLKIALFEKDGHIGGKCFSYIDPQGRAHDMGSIEETAIHHVIRELADEAGIQRFPLIPIREENAAGYSCSSLSFLNSIWNYTRICNAHKVSESWNFVDFAEDTVRTMSLEQLIKTYDLEPMRIIFERAFRLYGYGQLDQIPAGIAFSYIDTELILANGMQKIPLLGKIYGMHRPLPTSLLQEGFQRIFQNLVVQMQDTPCPLQVFLNTKIDRIDSTDKGVIVQAGSQQLWTARAAYVTSGWQHIVMPGIPQQVSEVFQSLIHENYGTTVFKTVSSLPYEGIMDYRVQQGLAPLMYGPKFSQDYSRRFGIAYAYGTPEQGEEIFKALQSSLEKRGITVEGDQPLAQRQVTYNPRFPLQVIQKGVFQTLDYYQGTGNIFFGGAPLSFELTEAVAAFSKRMVPRIIQFFNKRP